MVDRDTSEVLFIGGRSGVGKSSTAAEISNQMAAKTIRHAVIEGDNLDQAYPPPWKHGIPLAERNLAAMWQNYRDAGYSRLVYTNTVSVLEIDKLSQAIGGVVKAVGVLLIGSDAVVAKRLSLRESGASLSLHIQRSSDAARELDANVASQVHRIQTDGRSLTDIAAEILAKTGW